MRTVAMAIILGILLGGCTFSINAAPPTSDVPAGVTQEELMQILQNYDANNAKILTNFDARIKNIEKENLSSKMKGLKNFGKGNSDAK